MAFMIFEPPALTSSEEAVLERIRRLWSELHSNLATQSKRWTGLLARNLRAGAIQGSNSIEGILVSKEDALAAVDGEEPAEAEPDVWKAVTGYRTAMNYVLRLGSSSEFSYDPNLLRSLHYMMVQSDQRANPGAWRPGSVFVKNDATGEIVYTAPDRDLVPKLIDSLCTHLNAEDTKAPTRMVRAALAHLNLVMIHPFSDGNGRMSRCLQTLVLARGGVLDPTFCSIEEYLGRNAAQYYAALEEVGQGSWNPRRNTLNWVRFCFSAHYIQAKSAKRRLEYTALVGEAVEKILRERGLPDRAAVSLTNAVLGFKVHNEAYRREADVSVVVASRDLRALADAQLLRPHGEKRGRYYEAADVLVELRRLKQDARIPDPFTHPESEEA
ncbi:MAG TPA: Fic family protein [Kofleriaceae bacterium]|nr:Fic family protein [Kofleriaceae bacterium]